MNLRTALSTCLLVAAAWMSPNTSGAQDNPFGEAAGPPGPPRRVKVKELTVVADPWAARPEIADQRDLMREIEEAAARVRDAEGKEERSEARKKLWKLLDNYFEEDMQRRAEELAKIEERVKKLHALLEKRAAKKDDIIDLQMQVLENEADGLGFFNHGPENSSSTDMLLFAPKPGRLQFKAFPSAPVYRDFGTSVQIQPPADATAAPHPVPVVAPPAPPLPAEPATEPRR